MNLRQVSILCLLALSSILTAQDKLLTNSRHISSADGLPSNQIFDMTQDADGYIWMAAANGLCRYDGYQFYNIYNLGPDGDPIHGVVGYVFPDDDKRHLWMRTSTYVYCCYDLRTGTFIDFTGKKDYARTYRRFIRGRQGVVWMFDDESGVRRVKGSADGLVSCIDYTKASGTLPVNHVNDAFEDQQGRLWTMTSSGITIIDAQGKARTIAQGVFFRRGIQIGHTMLALTNTGLIYTFDENGRELRRIAIAADMKKINMVSASFEWHGCWMIMTNNETLMVNPKDGTANATNKYHMQGGAQMEGLSSDDQNHFVSNSTGILYVFPAKGDMRVLNLMQGVKSTVERFRRYNIKKGADGLYYIASYGNGLFVYDIEHDRLQHYSATSPWAIVGNSYLNNILIDRSGCIWLSEESTGLTCILPPDRTNADYFYPQPNRKGDWSNFVRMVNYAGGNRVLLSTRDNLLYELNPATWQHQQPQSLPAAVYAYYKDTKGHEWMGLRGGGLYIDGKRIDFPSAQIYDITEDPLGRLWIATWGDGLFVVHLEADGLLNTTHLMKRSYNESLIRIIRADNRHQYWLASNNGVYHIDMLKKTLTNNDLISHNIQQGDFPFDEISCLMPDSAGNIWVGGRGGGLQKCRYDNGKFTIERSYTTHDGLITNNILSITTDRQGNIWAGTDNGITCIRKDQKVNSYQFGHTMESNIYSENSTAMLPDGRLLFGTAYGMMILQPERLNAELPEKAGRPIITMVSIDGVARYLSTSDQQLVLNHDQNSIELGFSNLDYAGISSTQYRYYMEGVEHDWRQLTSDNSARYNSLPPGTYLFHLSSLNKNNQWSEEYVFTIIIRQPWYNTWWAWLIYLFIIGVLCWYFYRAWRRNFELNQQIRVEKELSTFRLNFFTHIAHEFRTPLAIISGAADKLTQKGSEQVSRSAVQTVRRGTLRLSKLVNQLMEFRRINTGNQRLGVMEGDIIKLGRATSDEFREMAARKEQQLTYTPFAHQYQMTFDPHLVETILYNLLSNAVKYTPQGGHISLKVKLLEERQQIQLMVEDNGPGISEQQMPQLFQPFMHGYVSQGGMGIGLYTAYQSARLHKGTLTYERIAAEGGSRFTVSLPASADVYTSEDYASATAVNTSYQSEATPDHIRELAPVAFNENITVAIIEDDLDMLDQIRDSVGRYFRTVSYTAGSKALAGIAEQQPHLILCDVMLPDINGFEIVRQLRASETSRHTPIIMLTALDGDDQLLRGYKAGADDYMVKPCNFELLILRITQLIKWYSRVQPIDTAASTAAAPQPIITDEADQRFREKMETIVAQHMGDPDFNVDMLAALLKMGRTKFYGKMKEFTGMSPNTYLQTERLKKAADLLIEGDLNVTEVSYKVGFQSPTYFYKCFKEKYGVPPSKYGKGQ
ncbi:two-component regulator propeller domain-containing protein [Prevotella sp. P6B1]|uniref:hybrid sensor histidine kinase/response regulator transcription factor n=1 Tax=Prevotella sp. P6B1 TaxID=1410613 RepID=UPI00051CA3CC|nr:two-component regulator propeller domain-containing protein [Prevotella sp. P6B1]